ncbi:uncharacterized protein EI90DRAFT_3080806 [Cantharellus anzutake]|uniref:uncharacterized protein n=1 Tax=Cantharellus anzutake TaxID=1750568 RepID=UPI001907B6DD|nr:uncharacterized protein EI90DRAFT_3080806 [Cantharellus anzutake]KAF8320627.1 hypothetical protein EI90DRAFT_3080806 [Cantharellus anzutake]
MSSIAVRLDMTAPCTRPDDLTGTHKRRGPLKELESLLRSLEATGIYGCSRPISLASVPPSQFVRQSAALEKCLSLASLERANLRRLPLQKHNSEIWLNKFPVELLSRIFERLDNQAVRDPFYVAQRIPGTVLMEVCKLWRDVAISTPFLWRRVSYRYHHRTRSYPPLSAIRLLVQRSRAVPLELEIVERPIGNRNSSINALLDMITFIRPHLSQCASLHLIVRSPDAVVALYPFSCPFPHLQSLALGPLRPESAEVFSESASPKTLILAQDAVPHSLHKFDSLSLKSFNIAMVDGIGLRDALCFLSGCKNLEVLAMHDHFSGEGAEEMNEDLLDQITVFTPNLRILRLTGVALLRCLSRWSAPLLQHLALAEDEPFTTVFDDSFHFPNLETVSLELLHQSLIHTCLMHLTNQHSKVVAIHLPSSALSIVNIMLLMCMSVADPTLPVLRLLRFDLEGNASVVVLPALECFLRMRRDVFVEAHIVQDSDHGSDETRTDEETAYTGLEQKYSSFRLHRGMYRPLHELSFTSSTGY